MPEKKKKKRNHVKVDITFRAEIIIDNGVSVEKLLRKETGYIFEPHSINGCVFKKEIKSIVKL